ncbi:MAG: tRNA (adenosine(37)-N6)-threonylcarbamoyltransferase complex ATPase subunit type 1 TsaE [Clostridia bacterium]|nr:tRNA (adenosine(37)-N6)-threonylcarbamoyltransferase complex ATPase subunit type 1 TsaE [Clostridia bacterium]
MPRFVTHSVNETQEIGRKLGSKLRMGDFVALFGPMGMGKTAFTRGLASGLGIDESLVSSPTFAIVNEYRSGKVNLCHFDMYRISGWDDLYSTGFFEYLDSGPVIVTEWSENIENALPDNIIRVEIRAGEKENDRIISITGDRAIEDFGN